VKNKYMKRIKNQFRIDPLHSTKSALHENHCSWRIRTRLRPVSGQGTQLLNVQQHVTQLSGMSMLKEKNLHSVTCQRSVRSQLVKKQFRIFSRDKYSQSITLQQNQCMHFLCPGVFSALFVCALQVL